MAANLLVVFFIRFSFPSIFQAIPDGDSPPGLIRRGVIRFGALVFVPLIVRILQNRDLSRRQQRFYPQDRSGASGIQPRPDFLQLPAGGLDSFRIVCDARLAVRLLRGRNPWLIGDLVL